MLLKLLVAQVSRRQTAIMILIGMVLEFIQIDFLTKLFGALEELDRVSLSEFCDSLFASF